jgi:hypothetical protein
MSQTCTKKRAPSKALALALCAALGFGVASAQAATKSRAVKPAGGQQLEAPVAGAVTVSDYEFNTFVYPAAIKRILFPAGSPVVGKPIYLADNTQVMLQFAKSSDKPVQMVAELDTGATLMLRLVPRPIPGITHPVNGARMRSASAPAADANVVKGAGADKMPAPKGEDIELLKVVASHGEAPAGFDPISLPQPTRFDKFTVVPLSGWSDGARRVLIFSLVAANGQTAVVAPPQFYRPGITAVMVDGDVVDANTSPQLYVVEELQDE